MHTLLLPSYWRRQVLLPNNLADGQPFRSVSFAFLLFSSAWSKLLGYNESFQSMPSFCVLLLICRTVTNYFKECWFCSGISTEDKALFASINASIPNIAPHGTRDGNFTGVNLADFVDTCWWSSTLCNTPANSTGLPPDIVSAPVPNSWLYSFDDGPKYVKLQFAVFFSADADKTVSCPLSCSHNAVCHDLLTSLA